METDTVENVALKKVKATLETCICLCAHGCKKEALIGLRSQIMKLFDQAIEGHGTGGKQ